jgi:IS605 OrfB family transposase
MSKLDKNTFNMLDEMTYLSKNIYNSALYEIKNYYNSTGSYLDYQKCWNLIKSTDNYVKMPSQVGQQTLKITDRGVKSFFSLLRKKYSKGGYNKRIEFPKFLKKDSHFILIYTKQYIRIKNNKIYLCLSKYLTDKYKTKLIVDLPEYIKDNEIKEIRIIPRNKYFDLHIVYKQEELKEKLNNEYLSIDLGIDNLMTCVDTKNHKSFIIDGKHFKWINQFFNKTLADKQSILKIVNNKYNSNKIGNLYNKRNNYLNNQFHLISKRIVDYCIDNQIYNIVIGYNKLWKDNSKMSKKTNQNFVQLPFGKLTNFIEYKCKLNGINFKTNEESYTSKCDALALESIKKQEVYSGKRIERGLFKSSNNKVINSDVNGALNILRKVDKCKGESFVKKITESGAVIVPIKIRLNDLSLAIFL